MVDERHLDVLDIHLAYQRHHQDQHNGHEHQQNRQKTVAEELSQLLFNQYLKDTVKAPPASVLSLNMYVF